MNEQETSELREMLMEEGRKTERGTANKLDPRYYNTILGTMEYFGADEPQLQMGLFDLKVAKYKIWDWLSMALGGRYGDAMIPTFAKFARIYIEQKNVGGFAQFLAGHDLDFEEPHFCQDCIDTYMEVTGPDGGG